MKIVDLIEAAPVKWSGKKAYFTVGSEELVAKIKNLNGWMVGFEFYHKNDEDMPWAYKANGESKNPTQVFRTVVEIAREYLKKNTPNGFAFTADEEKRKALYIKLGKQMVKGLDYDVMLHKGAHIVLVKKGFELPHYFSATLVEGVQEKEEYTDPKKVYALLKKWTAHNTPKIGDIKVHKRYKETDADYLYRGVELDRREIESLRDGKKVELSSKGYSSWSEDKDVAKTFAHGSGASGVIIKKAARKLDVFLDIDEYLFRKKLQSLGDEQEIIIKDSPESLTITKSDLVDFD